MVCRSGHWPRKGAPVCLADRGMAFAQGRHEPCLFVETRKAGREGARDLALGNDHDAVVVGDAFLLRQMVANLVDNACDFAPADSDVTVALTPRAGDRLAITVADRGPGVPAYALDRVFERFYSLPRPHGGSRSSGIGLAFVAEVAALHGGRATLANRDGGGAVATIELPRPSATS